MLCRDCAGYKRQTPRNRLRARRSSKLTRRVLADGRHCQVLHKSVFVDLLTAAADRKRGAGSRRLYRTDISDTATRN